MNVRRLSQVHEATTDSLPAVRAPITRKLTAMRPPVEFVRLVYRKLPADLSLEDRDARRLHEEIRQSILDYAAILHSYPAVLYLSDVRLSQIVRFGFTAYFVRSGQMFRAIPFRRGDLPDGVIVCASA